MRPKTTPAKARARAQLPTPQLDLPFVQQTAVHDLSYYIGLCSVFAAYHKRWPTREATREEFRAARIADYDGQRIDRELRFPSPELELDPAYRKLRERCRADPHLDTDEVDLAALDPRQRTVLSARAIAGLLDTVALPGPAKSGTVRYATGVPAHAPDELSLRVAETLRARALQAAGFDARDPRARARSYAVRVRVTDELRSFIDRAGMGLPAPQQAWADSYVLDLDEQGRLSVRYQLFSGSRYAGSVDAERLVAKLASLYAADPGMPRPG